MDSKDIQTGQHFDVTYFGSICSLANYHQYGRIWFVSNTGLKNQIKNSLFRNSCTIFHGKGLTSNSKYGSWVSSHQMQKYGRAQDERFSKKEKLTIWMVENRCSRKKKWYLLTLILIYPASVIARRNISRIVLYLSICFFSLKVISFLDSIADSVCLARRGANPEVIR